MTDIIRNYQIIEISEKIRLKHIFCPKDEVSESLATTGISALISVQYSDTVGLLTGKTSVATGPQRFCPTTTVAIKPRDTN